jgi:hypothetical protein
MDSAIVEHSGGKSTPPTIEKLAMIRRLVRRTLKSSWKVTDILQLSLDYDGQQLCWALHS